MPHQRARWRAHAFNLYSRAPSGEGSAGRHSQHLRLTLELPQQRGNPLGESRRSQARVSGGIAVFHPQADNEKILGRVRWPRHRVAARLPPFVRSGRQSRDRDGDLHDDQRGPRLSETNPGTATHLADVVLQPLARCLQGRKDADDGGGQDGDTDREKDR